MRIALINPPEFKNTESILPKYMVRGSAFKYPPLGLLYLASNLIGNHECKIIDSFALRDSPYDCLEEIREYRPSVVGMTVFTDSLYSCFFLSKEIKDFDPSIKIVLGGPHINVYPEATIRWLTVDYVLTGFSENSFASLVEALDGDCCNIDVKFENIPGLWWKKGINIFKPNSSVDRSWDINTIKRPNRRLLDTGRYFTVANSQKITTMISSRGCPFSCNFCDVLVKRYQERDIDDIVDELKEIAALGISQVLFFDDCFNVNRNRVVEICRAFIDNDLRFEWSFRGRIEPCDEELAQLLYKAGCRRAHLGIEGTDQKTINRTNKKINISRVPKILKIYNKHHIETMGYFILGFPFQTYEDCIISCERIVKMGFDYIFMSILTPCPNTEIYKELLNTKIFEKDIWREHAINPQPDFKLGQWHPYIDREKLEELLDKYYKGFYFSPKFLVAELRRTRSMYSFAKKFKLALTMIKNKYS